MMGPLIFNGKKVGCMIGLSSSGNFSSFAKRCGMKPAGRQTVRNRKGEIYQMSGWLPWQIGKLWRLRQQQLSEIERQRTEIPRAEVRRLTLDGWSDVMIGHHLGFSHGRIAHVRQSLGLTGNPNARRRNFRCGHLRLDGEPVGEGAVAGFSHSLHVTRSGEYTCTKRPRTILREDYCVDVCLSSRCQSCQFLLD